MNNSYEGVTYIPQSNRYEATIPSGRFSQIVGYFDTLQEAIDARSAALNQKQGSR